MAHLFKNAALQNIPASNTVLYQCPSTGTQSSVHTLVIANITGTITVKASVLFYDSSQDITVDLLIKAEIESGNTLEWNKPINLMSDDQILIKAENPNEISAFASVLEVV